jgi:hypothetical protein
VKRDIPNTLFLHIIRDGRDIALSLKKMGGFAPLPWDRSRTDNSTFLESKLWLKMHTPVGRFTDLSFLELENEPVPIADPTRR